MNNIIYAITPLRTFIGGIFGIGLFFVLGVAGVFWGIGRKKDSVISRIGSGCSGIILLLVGVVVSFILVRTIISGSVTVDAHLDKKTVAISNCGDDGGQCTSYVLETNSGQKQYDFTLPKSAYEKAEVDACYEFTYYPAHPLFDLFQNEKTSSLYEATDSISRVERVDSSKCQ